MSKRIKNDNEDFYMEADDNQISMIAEITLEAGDFPQDANALITGKITGAMEIEKATITVNGVEISATIDESGTATIPCVKDDIVEIDFTKETGIAPIMGESNKDLESDATIYDIYGRRIYNPAPGQIYIQNGVKRVSK